ncbi:hypothetical protein BGLA2_930036 [Burkholderia gladioli]|nr:hypothetical protein BGLA2_930036 [Burkholderia gladioli]
MKKRPSGRFFFSGARLLRQSRDAQKPMRRHTEKASICIFGNSFAFNRKYRTLAAPRDIKFRL